MGGRTPARAMPELSLHDAVFLVENQAELKKTMERWEAKNAEIVANIELQGKASQIPQLHKAAEDAIEAATQRAERMIAAAREEAAEAVAEAKVISDQAVAGREKLTHDQAAFKQEQQTNANNNESVVTGLDDRDRKLAELELKVKQDAEAAAKAKTDYLALKTKAEQINALP